MDNKKIKITELREIYKTKVRLKGDEVAADGSKFEIQEKVRYKEVNYVDGWARFGHYMLDYIIFNIMVAVFTVLVVIVIAMLGFEVSRISEENGAFDLISRLVNWVVFYPAYYILFESTMQTTPGKLIMKRVVVDEYGEKPSFAIIVKRSFIRIIPFEAFSCFSSLGWHDNWTDTFVIRKSDLQELKLLQEVQQM